MTSKIKVDNINKVSDDSNIIKKCGTTITLGASGDSIALASGASQTGFGRTGTVDWQTTPKTAATFTAVNGEGYFVNTTSNAITMTMPSGSAGAIVSIQDYNKTFDDNNFTITPASGEKINGGNVDGSLIIATEGQGLTFVYVDATVGWKTVHENEFTSGGSNFIVATGGTITESGNCKIHTFTGPGTFTVDSVAVCAANNLVSYMVVAGGGGSGTSGAGGGGAGGYREVKSPVTPYTASPLDGYPSAPNRITVTATGYPITVGGGGAGLPKPTPIPGPGGARGGPSIFSTITSTGGGGSPSQTESITPTAPGGSGGGLAKGASGPAGVGNTPPVSPSQGNNGGVNGPAVAGGGGGAGGVGTDGNPAIGGAGTSSEINGSAVVRSGGGGGGSDSPPVPGGPAHPGGGGGGQGGNRPDTNSTNGTDNTGGGAGGLGEAGACGQQRNGGSGIVIIRYKFQ